MITAIIIDDEERGRINLKTTVERYCPELAVCEMAEGINDAMEKIITLRPQLLFLDIEMRDGTGFDLLEQCPYKEFEVIFVTAYNQYGLNAIRFSAIDYILKPIDPDLLIKAVRKTIEQIDLKQENQRLKNLLFNANASNGSRRLALPFVDKLEFVEIADMIRLEASGSYTTFFLQGGEEIVVSKSLKEYDEMLVPVGFIRTHQAHLVNPDYIKSLVKSDGGYMLMQNGDCVPISRLRKNDIISQLRQG